MMSFLGEIYLEDGYLENIEKGFFVVKKNSFNGVKILE